MMNRNVTYLSEFLVVFIQCWNCEGIDTISTPSMQFYFSKMRDIKSIMDANWAFLFVSRWCALMKGCHIGIATYLLVVAYWVYVYWVSISEFVLNEMCMFMWNRFWWEPWMNGLVRVLYYSSDIVFSFTWSKKKESGIDVLASLILDMMLCKFNCWFVITYIIMGSLVDGLVILEDFLAISLHNSRSCYYILSFWCRRRHNHLLFGISTKIC